MFDKKRVKEFPDSAGVYLMKDSAGAVIYIGKAASLRKRLSSYFSGQPNTKTAAMLLNMEDIQTLNTRTEAEALLLEMKLIKKYKPRYNISLKDDKSYPFVKLTRERFPAVFICRNKKNDEALYLGPFTSAKLLKQALKIARMIFPFRSCRLMPKRECLYARIGLCPAPCGGKITPRAYAGTLANLKNFLLGDYEDVIRKISARMRRSAKQQKFEEAAKLRDMIDSLGAVNPGIGLLSQRNREVVSLGKALGMKGAASRIEAFDISNFSESCAVGSMVSFLEGLPDKDNYRRFRIKEVAGVDDYAMIREVVRRRYSRLIEEKKDFPDLIIIDGGKGHLNAASSVLKELGLRITLISIAKQEEKVFLTGKRELLEIAAGSSSMHLIQRVRDEAHRFAVSYHRLLRSKGMISSG